MKEFEGKKLLVLGGFFLACDIVKHAQAMGAYVIVVDYNEKVPAKEIADKFVPISATDVDSIVDFCKTEHVDGVTTGFVDILLEPCYEICKRLGLPCYLTPHMISMSTSKLEFKDKCEKFNVPVPKTYLVGGEISDNIYNKIQYPVFVKPLDSSGSRGAGVCNSREELDIQFKKALSFSPTNNAVIEDYLTGREFLLNIFAVAGEYRVVSMVDRYVCEDRGSAINYANVSFMPSKSIGLYLNSLNNKVNHMFKSLNFLDGLFFLQGYYDGQSITFFEMGCRLGGSYYNLEKASIGLDPVDMTVRYALTGKMVDNISAIPYNIADHDTIAMCLNFLLKDQEATIGEIQGVDKCVELPACIAYEQRHFVGDHYTNERTVDRPIFSIYLVEKNKEHAIEDVDFINNTFKVYDNNGLYLLKQKFDIVKI